MLWCHGGDLNQGRPAYLAAKRLDRNDPALIADLHAIKRKAGAKSFIYDSDRNEHGHADRFWALALALSYFEKVRDKRGKAYII